jgi:hypothetical protein
MHEAMRDAAFAQNIPVSWAGVVAGYLRFPTAFHPWSAADWSRFGANKKLPIVVAGSDGRADAHSALAQLRALGVAPGCITALDLETRVDAAYVSAYGSVMSGSGFPKVWVYGSASTVFGNPGLAGYWVADYAGIGPFMYDGGHIRQVRATQYANGQGYDSSTVKAWQLRYGKWWV